MSLDELSATRGKSPTLKGCELKRVIFLGLWLSCRRANRMKKESPYSSSGGRGGGGRGGGGGGSKRVYVGNLDWKVSWQDLKDHFRSCGEVVYADVMTEGGQSGKGRSKVSIATLKALVVQ